MNPKISVVIPMYNSKDTIIECIESVLNQTYKDYEILIMDDGSSDGCYNIVESYILKNNLDSRVFLYKQDNSGPSKARNELIKKAKGEYIAFLDSDDIWKEEKLYKQVEVLSLYKDVKLVATNINNIKNNKLKYLNIIDFNKLLLKNYFFTPTVIVSSKVVEQLNGFNEDKKYSEDYDLWLRICKNNKCVLINESLVYCGKGKPLFGHSGLSSKLKEMELGELDNFYKLYINRDINILTLVKISFYSYFKYIRRIILTKLR